GEDKKGIVPLDPDETAAAKTEALKGFDLGSLSQRLAKLGVKIPRNPTDMVVGVYQLQSVPNALVASDYQMPAGEQDYPSAPTFDAIPLNAAAIEAFGTTDK